MTARRRPVAATLVALVLGGVVAAALVVLAAGFVRTVLAQDLANAPFFLVFMALPASLGWVGVLLALRRPGNAVGWLLLVSGALAGLAFASGEYVRTAAAHDLEQPIFVAAAWMSNTWFVPAIGLLVVYLPLLFPTGRLPGPRWRFLAAVSAVGIVAGAVGPATAPITVADTRTVIPNPLTPPEPLFGWLQAATTASNAVAPAIFLAAVASLLVRFRRSDGVERQQIKWFLFATAIVATAFAVSLLNVPPISDVAWFVGLVTMALLPAAIAMAILRYRLYDIDRIVSRAVAYATVTGILGALFAAVVLVAQAVLEPVTRSNAAGVAASTLLVASLFQPVRRRVQAAADRRFDRTRYDAEREIDAFAARVRDEVEVERVVDEVGATVRTALAPSVVAVWTRPIE